MSVKFKRPEPTVADPPLKEDPFVEDRRPDKNFDEPAKKTYKRLKCKMNIHKQPNVGSDVAVTLPAGSVVEEVSTDGTWTKIKQGYVLNVFLMES